jgi:hypothetical protein
MNSLFEGCTASAYHAVYVKASTNNQNFKFFTVTLIYSEEKDSVFYLSVPSLTGIKNDRNLNRDKFQTFKNKFEGWCVELSTNQFNKTHFKVHGETPSDDVPLTDLICKSLFVSYFYFFV